MKLPRLIFPPQMTFWHAMQAGLIQPVESEDYLAWVRTRPCVLTGGKADAHHMVGHGLKPNGGKVSDLLTFPLAPKAHRPQFAGSLHHWGSTAWERQYGDQRVFVLQTLVEAIHRGVIKTG